MYITTQLLKSKNACEWPVLRFEEIFPSGRARVTRKNLVKYAEETNKLSDFEWLVHQRVVLVDQREFDERRDELFKQCLAGKGLCRCSVGLANLIADLMKLR